MKGFGVDDHVPGDDDTGGRYSKKRRNRPWPNEELLVVMNRLLPLTIDEAKIEARKHAIEFDRGQQENKREEPVLNIMTDLVTGIKLYPDDMPARGLRTGPLSQYERSLVHKAAATKTTEGLHKVVITVDHLADIFGRRRGDPHLQEMWETEGPPSCRRGGLLNP